MKKSALVLVAMSTFLLFGCSEKESATSDVNSEKKVQPSEEKIGEPKISTIKETQPSDEEKKELDVFYEEIETEFFNEGDIRFRTQLTGLDGKEYRVYIKPTKETKTVVEDAWAGADAGDTVFSGDYQVYVSDGENTVRQQLELKDITVNPSRSEIRKIEGESDALLVYHFETTNTNIGDIYAIQNGEFVQLKNEHKDTDSFVFTGSGFKQVLKNQFQTAYYENMEGTWTFIMFKLNPENHLLTKISEEKLDSEEGSKYYNTYLEQE